MNLAIDQSEENKRPSPTLVWVLIGAVLTAGVFFRFYNLEKKVYWFDEAGTSLWVSGHTWEEVKQTVGDREIGVEDLKRFQRINRDRGLLSTVTALSVHDPQLSPFYYGLAHVWAGLFGDSIWGIRSLSAFASLLVFPCLYWLCRELFEMRLVAWVALMIVAVSPFHVLYAQEARQYSLWTVTVLLSSAVLLWAQRSQTKRAWTLYAASVAVGMYTNALFGLVVMAHAVYVIGNGFAQRGRNPRPVTKTSIPYVTATLAGLIAFGPWLYMIVVRFNTASSNVSWLSGNVNPFHLIAMWAHNISSIFLDTNHTLKSVIQHDSVALVSYAIRFLLLILAVYAVCFVYAQARRRTRLFVLALIVMPMVMIALPDFLLGGARSGLAARYLLPCYLGLQLALAHLLTTQMTVASLARRRGWQVVTALVIACGVLSCTISSRAQTWWIKPSYSTLQQAGIINQCKRPLVIMPVSGYLLSFSHVLHPKVRLWVSAKPEALQVRDGFSDVFMVNRSNLSPLLRQRLEQDKGFRMEAVDKRGELWRLTRETSHPKDVSGHH